MSGVFPLDRYLARIGLAGAPGADEDGLRAFHEGQARHIPFENFDIHLDRALSLAPDGLVAKLIDAERGGYCFELNGLFEPALRAAGFDVRAALARVVYNRPDPIRNLGPRTHQVLVVNVGARDWLADVGFGGPGPRHPLPLEDGFTDRQGDDYFRIVRDERLGWVLQRDTDSGWLPLYGFADEVTVPDDIALANFYCEQAPDSIFRNQRMASILTEAGRTTLSGFDLTRRAGGPAQSETLTPDTYMDALAAHFGLRLGADYTDFMELPG